jgi:hypothetical protein
MNRLQKAAAAIAGILALAGTGLVAAFVFGEDPRTAFLSASAALAVLSVLAALASLLTAFLPRRSLGENAAPTDSEGDSSWRSGLEKRLDSLHIRLHIDPPRLCSQHKIACTCWSLCGKDAPAPGAPPERAIVHIHDARPEAQAALPAVCRKAMDDCPFRFTAPSS